MKIKTKKKAEDTIFFWYTAAIKEIEYASNRIFSNSKNREAHLYELKRGIFVLYSHWEGFVKKTAQIYLSYISFRKIPVKNISDILLAFFTINIHITIATTYQLHYFRGFCQRYAVRQL